MDLSNEKKNEYIKRLLMSRMRILCNHGFYGLLLMHMIYALDENCETAATDGRRIFFAPKFLDELSDTELDFIMMHEILHVVLQHCLRQGERDDELFNIACDIVVNSNILFSNNMDFESIMLKKYGESMHVAPNGKEGYEYTAEQVYEMLSQFIDGTKQNALSGNFGNCKKNGETKRNSRNNPKHKIGGQNKTTSPLWDDHTRWDALKEDEKLQDEWVKRVEDACEIISIRDPSNSYGSIPLCVERILKELKKPQIDWRTILNNFVQEEIVDYSFTPPDKRFDDCPFFLPDFNDKSDVVENILFMVDTSGSMSDDMVAVAYFEIKGAIDQFDGKLKGWLGFFDAKVFEPKPFGSVADLKKIKPVGGGGTNYHIIFEYIQKYMQDCMLASVIILTDGYADFPNEKLTCGIPVLWLLNNENITPPWGKVARIKV